MLSDDGAVGLLCHDETKKIFTHLIVGVRLKLMGGVLGRGGACVVGDYCLGLAPPEPTVR